MSEKILVPVLGESITEATVSKWLKNEGDVVEADEPIVELETDKVNLEVPSPISGTLIKINSKDGSTVEVGALLGSVSENGSTLKKKEEIKKIEPTIEKDNVVKLETQIEDNEPEVFENKIEVLEEKEAPLVLTEEIKEEPSSFQSNDDQSLSPAVRKIVTENEIDISSVKGTGKDGRILKGDLINLMGVNPPPSERKIKYGHEERIKMTRLRQTIAKRLKQAQENAALLTTFNEVDMSSVMEMRRENQEDFQSRYGIKLGFMSFFVKACVVALKNFPAVNAEIDGDEIIYKNYYNISFAVGTDKGLVVPVLRNADELSFADIEKNIKEISEKARDGKLSIEDLQGGTFTISNGGIYGSMLSTPILNLPQSGVLGMHNIVQRPVVVDGNVERIMSRVFKIETPFPEGKKQTKKFAKVLSENRDDRPSDYAQALMDLGSMICTPTSPKCTECPVLAQCNAYKAGKSALYPIKAPKKERPKRYGAVYWITDRQGNALFEKRPEKGLLGGMIALPTSSWETEPKTPPTFKKFKLKPTKQHIKHVFTHFELRLDIYIAECSDLLSLPLQSSYTIYPIKEGVQLGLPTVFKKAYLLAKDLTL